MVTSTSPTGTPYRAQTPCPCCSNHAARIVATRDGKTREALTTIACESCGLGRTDPLPSPEALQAWYATKYRQEYKSAFMPARRHVLRAGRIALDRWTWLQTQGWQRPTPGHRPATLDIGASSGEFVFLMTQLGFDAVGLEPHEGYASYARDHLNLDVRNGSVQNLASMDAAKRWDLVTLFHVFEHLSDPVASLQTIANHMSEQGVLFIEVPNATRLCSPHSMFFKAHVLYFSADSLRHTLRTAGWDVLGHNSDEDGNLRIMARPNGESHSQEPVPHGHDLVRAQQARRWGSYLMDEFRSRRLLSKLRTRREEKRSASQFQSGAALLKDLYADVVTAPSQPATQSTPMSA